MKFGWLVLLLACGCAELPTLAPGECGNGVVEAGEDCDSDSDPFCGAVKTQNACRRLCDQATSCPAGAACGGDGVCRRPSDRFELVQLASVDYPTELRLADIDGNKVDDLVTLDSLQELSVRYHGPQAQPLAVNRFVGQNVSITVGNLKGDKQGLDVVHLTERAVGVLRGASDRSLVAKAYAPIEVPDKDTSFLFAFDALPNSKPGSVVSTDEVLLFHGTNISSVIESKILFSVGWDAAKAVAPPVHGHVDVRKVSPCAEFLVSAGSDVQIFTPCTQNAASYVWHKTGGKRAVAVPSGFRVERIFVGDVDGVEVDVSSNKLAFGGDKTKTEDLVVLLRSESSFDFALAVAYGLGDGSFNSTSQGTLGIADNVAGLVLDSFSEPLLAVGDLNQDERVDFVFPGKVALSSPPSVVCTIPSTGPVPQKNLKGYQCISLSDAPQTTWVSAQVADLNANGFPDIIAADCSRRVLFFNGTGTATFHRSAIPTLRYPKNLEVGDLDGDLVMDLALTEATSAEECFAGDDPWASSSALSLDSLSVSYGRPFAPPAPPAALGQLGQIRQMITGNLAATSTDQLTDLAVVAEKGKRAVAVFEGNTARQLESPFRLAKTIDQDADFAEQVGVGDFDGDGDVDIAVQVSRHSELNRGLWFLANTGKAELSASNETPTNLPNTVGWCSALVPIDLEGDSKEELVLISQSDIFFDGGNADPKSTAWLVRLQELLGR